MKDEKKLKQLDNDIKKLDNLKEKVISKKQLIENYNSDIIDKGKHSIRKPKSRYWYFASFGINSIIIIGWLVIAFIGKMGIFSILFIIFSIPVFLISLMVFVIRLILDKQKISDIKNKVLVKNFIIADFLTNNRRIISVTSPINKDGISFTLGKRDYLIDKEQIWFDKDKNPHSFYLPELPNSLKFDFTKTIGEYFQIINTLKHNEEIPLKTLTNDIAFSSENLQLFKKDKVIGDLNKPQNTVDQKTFNSMMLLMGGIIFVFLIIIIIAIVT